MANNTFITIGSKGTVLPGLRKLDPPLQIGANGIAFNGINWSRGPYEQLGKRAGGWVSEAKKDDPFYLFPLHRALTEARVVHVAQIVWNYNGRNFRGEGFFPASWSSVDGQPIYVAVRAPGWEHGCVERDWKAHNRGKWVATLDLTQAVIQQLSINDPVDIEDEIEEQRDSFAHEPETTRQAIIKARRGQGPFREKLKKLWRGQCAVTQCKATRILQATLDRVARPVAAKRRRHG